MKIYDLVELVKDKPKYSKAGVFQGMFGAVMSKKAIEGEGQVIFSEFHTGNAVADILVKGDDLKIHSFMPPERIPKN